MIWNEINVFNKFISLICHPLFFNRNLNKVVFVCYSNEIVFSIEQMKLNNIFIYRNVYY